MKNNFNIDEFLKRDDFDKSDIMSKLEESVLRMKNEGFDLDETLAFIEGSQHNYPMNIPLFKLWTKRIWKKLEEIA